MSDKPEQPAAQQVSSAMGDVASTNSPQALRLEAEARLRAKAVSKLENINAQSQLQTRQMLHELQVHQIELEMQNEELRDAQVALDFERARYFDLYDLAPIGYCTLSEQGLIMQANLTVASLLGSTRSELLNQRWTRFVYKDDADLYYLHRKKLVESGEPQSCELRMIKKDGTQFWGQWAATLAPIANGKLELRTVLSDITERKRAESALRETERNYRALADASLEIPYRMSADWSMLLPLDGRELFANSDRPLADWAWVDHYLPSDEHTRVRQTVSEAIAHKKLFEMEHRVLRPDGSTAWVRSRAVPILDDNEGLVEWFGAASDITERKRIEQELIKSTALADKANRAKSEFLSSMSHELRTPLNAILGFAQLIEFGTPLPTPTQKLNIDYILKAGWYLLALVDEILDLAVIESGTLSLSMEAVALEEVMRECQAMLEPQAQTRGIRMTFPRFDVPCNINADKKRLKQVLSNLLSNAIKYNRPNGSVVADWVLNTAGRIRITVEDTGDGLSAERLAYLFQPFNRLGKETGTEQGTGIGLVVSKRIVEMMGGEIGVQSIVGKGSVFWFELNLADNPLPVADVTQAATVALMPEHIDMPLRTLLYVEDNLANLALVEAIISRRPDLRLLTATDGDKGIEIARAVLPDVILMDINLPGISGVEAMKMLAKDSATAHIPVLALSANAIARDIAHGLEAGFFRYLTKPIKINEFIDTLDIALEFSSSTASRIPKKVQ